MKHIFTPYYKKAYLQSLKRVVNYYKILGLENYASIAEVKRAYKEKIRIYHPDINTSPEALEMAKILNLAKGNLDTETAKTKYDKELKLAYLIEIQRLHKVKTGRGSVLSSFSRREKIKKAEETKKLRIKDKYEKSLQKFPLSLRILGIGVLMLWWFQLMYSHYFIYYGSVDRQVFAFGLLLFALGAMLGANETYTHYIVKSIKKAIPFNFEKIISVSFILSFVLGISGIIVLNNVRKDYLLKHNFDYTIATIDYKASQMDRAVVEFVVDGHTYKRQLDTDYLNMVRLGRGKTVIKYAVANPIMCEAVKLEEANKLPPKF